HRHAAPGGLSDGPAAGAGRKGLGMGFHSTTAFASATRVARGARNHAAGRLAEDSAAAHYLRRGGRILAQRWRCPWGEIDLIVALGDSVIFVEVKSARTH